MSRDPSITIGVGAVVFRGEEVLLIRRGKAPFEGQWSIPGGSVEYGEALQDAVRREVREETGVEIDILGLLDVFEARPGANENEALRHMVLIDYVAQWRSGEPKAGDDAAEAVFVSVETALARLSWAATREAIKRAVEMRANGAAASRNGPKSVLGRTS
jgi:8-oxo-dGTP diphosphatase